MADVALFDYDAERALLGAMLLSADAIAAGGRLSRADFHKPEHGVIFDAILAVAGTGAFPEPVTVAAQLNGSLEAVGGKDAIVRLAAETPTSANAGAYAGIVGELARTRRAQATLADAHEAIVAGRDWTPYAAELAGLQVTGQTTSHLISGAAFMNSQGVEYPTIWGAGEDVLWAAGQSLFITGPTGVGKSTLTIQLVAGRLGLQEKVLGYDVEMTGSRVLYLAMDRPSQILRLFKRRFTDPGDLDALESDLVVWRGPLETDLAHDPGLLLRLAREASADTVVIDSLKDTTAELSTDEAGGGINRALQTTLADGVEVLVLHHQRKGAQGAKPKSIEDMHGNSAFKNGAGSVALLWGEAGDSEIELIHLKQPVMEVGPLQVTHDHRTGISTVAGKPTDPFMYMKGQVGGVTAEGLARADTKREVPGKNDIAKAKRKLDDLVKKGIARCVPGGSEADRYVAVVPG